MRVCWDWIWISIKIKPFAHKGQNFNTEKWLWPDKGERFFKETWQQKPQEQEAQITCPINKQKSHKREKEWRPTSRGQKVVLERAWGDSGHWMHLWAIQRKLPELIFLYVTCPQPTPSFQWTNLLSYLAYSLYYFLIHS